ncbi:hypothetical protein EV379_1623 [Microterricola gilva]|uniref:Uncharacterized protein n=1 Tax=Microterricola gilva TaxID=393267 RepID=A0A4Q8AMX1_9MICO|nr:hypothetical protein [Microterricola gilva]RZU65295.1 hypothetical protein EV379_1623 [Microterricola gilva]
MSELAIADTVEAALVIAHVHGRVAPIDSLLRTERARGTVVKLRRGLYARRELWLGLTPTQRYQAFVIGVARGGQFLPVLSHESAAVLHGLPRIEPWPRDVHELVERGSGGRSAPGRQRHAVGIDDVDVICRDGLYLTSIERTVVDVAATSSTFSAVAAIDAALHVDRFGRASAMTTTAELLRAWERMLPFRGSARARELIEFGDGRSGSVNESNSRVTMAQLGLPVPELQRSWQIDGADYDSDFYFAGADAIGEADGKAKYTDPVLLAGRAPADVVYAEKLREDALRRRTSAFARWDYAVGMSLSRLGARLAEVGVLPTERPRLRATR